MEEAKSSISSSRSESNTSHEGLTVSHTQYKGLHKIRSKIKNSNLHASSFLDTYLHGHYFQTLADTGNLSTVDLIDYTVFKRAFKNPKERPLVTKIKHPILTAGYHKLKGIGMCRLDLSFGDYNKQWQTDCFIVKNLGVPAILSVDSMSRMPIILDPSRSLAQIGPKKHNLPLRPFKEVRRRPDVSDINVNMPFCYFTDADVKQTEVSRLARDVTLEPNSIAYGCIGLPKSQQNGLIYYYKGESPLMQRKKIVSGLYVINSQKSTRVKSPDGQVKFMPGGLYVPLVNPNPEKRIIKAGQVIGSHSLISQPEVDNEFGTNRLRGTDLYAMQKPLELLPIPDLKKLYNKPVSEIKKALDAYSGPIPDATPQELGEMRKTLDELNANQIKSDKNLSNEEKDLLYHVLLRYYDYFSKHKYDCGKTDLIEFVVDTGDAKPIKARTRPMNPLVLESFRDHLKQQLENGILEPGFGEWAAPVHQVWKLEAGDWRFVGDLRGVNAVTKTDSYPIAHQQMATVTDEFRKCESFINLDLTGAYLAVPVEKESQDKLALTTCEGLFKCLRMPFGAKNACSCYARLMRIVFDDMMVRRESLSFFDDHLILCPDFLTGLFRFSKFMYAIARANLRVSLKKSHFFVKKVRWLGFEATAGELLPSDKHIAKVRDWPVPTSSKQIQSFYGLANYHRRFIKDFAAIARPLKLVEAHERSTGDFVWTDLAQKSFDTIKKILISKPLIVHPDFSLPFYLDTDASLYAMGAELIQIRDGKEHVVSYGSRMFTKAEANYSVSRKELLAVVTFVQEFQFYFRRAPLIIRTDHSALQWFTRTKNLTGQLYRWWLDLHPFKFTIQHRPGRKHGNADALSRYPYPDEDIAKLTPAFTQEDEEMYNSLGLKIPKHGSIGKKIAESREIQKSGASEKKSGPSLRTVHMLNSTGVSPSTTPISQLHVTTRSQAANLDNVAEEIMETSQEEANLEEIDSYQTDDLTSALESSDDAKLTNLNPSDCHCSTPLVEGEMLSLPANFRNFLSKKVSHFDMTLEQSKDDTIVEVRKWLKNKKRPNWATLHNSALKEYYRKFYNLELIDNELYLLEKQYKRLCIPAHMSLQIISLLHQHPLSGHIGQHRTYLQARRLFYWPSMLTQIEEAVRNCEVCIKAKKRKPEKQVPLGQTSTGIQNRFSVFYADLVGPWIKHPSPGKYQYLLTLMDGFTKYPEAIPLPRADTAAVIKALSTHILPRYGVGFRLVTDRGSQFTSSLFSEACKSLGLLASTTQAYEPHSNPVERMHRTLETAIRCLMLQDNVVSPSSWSDYVPAALASLRQTPLSNLPYSPHFLTYGEEPVIPAQISTNHLLPGISSTDPMGGIDRLRKAMVDIRSKQLANHLKNKALYDKKVKEQPLKVGDLVYLWSNIDPSPLGQLRKTSTYYRGPYPVVAIHNERQICIRKGGAEVVVSRDRLSLLPQPDIQLQLQDLVL